jgi:DNA-binding beta-propeller fold protein YncE
MRSLIFGLVFVGLAAAFGARAESVIVLNSDDASYSIIDRATRTEIARLPVGREPHHLIETPDKKELLVGSTVTNELLSLDTTNGEKRRVVRDIVDPYQLGYSPDGKWFVTTAYRLDHVDVYQADGFKLVSRVFIDGLPSHLDFDQESKTVFVTLQQSGRVVAFDLGTQAIKWNVEVGKAPAGIVMLPDNKRILVANTGEDGIVILDPKDGAITGRLQTGKGAHNFWPMGDGRRYFLSNRIENVVSILDTQDMKIVGSVTVPGGPDDMIVTADGKELWVTQRFIRRVAVVDIAQMKVVASIRVGKSPHGLYVFKGNFVPPAGTPTAGSVPVRAASTEGERK